MNYEAETRGEKFQMTNDKCQINFEIADTKCAVWRIESTSICFMLKVER